ncbi:cytochrome c/FTR1 family iron permease [Steroidobacter cummioxidans]|uniref:cytochrome c/FTR1 family iron permease n=1 Tax=Steroidobacter cummioxidans TaxID=1803913 RepID=UPI001F4E7B92|nr:cytochrome c/FTR1 family iron permease [Steroidobacter cummioxidans]
MSAEDDKLDLQVRQLWQLIDYVAVDYAGAVADGQISNEGEYKEMVEFTATIRERVDSLPARAGQAQLTEQSQLLETAVSQQADAAKVAQIAHGLGNQLLTTYPVPIAPKTVPDLARGAALYQEQCVACHGVSGHGDGPAAAQLDPPPIAFTDADRARSRSLYSLYEAISQGVGGTAMPGFPALSPEDRWALSFYIGTLAYPPTAREEGAKLWQQDPSLRSRIPNLEALVRKTENELSSELGPDRAQAVLSYLRATPAVLAGETGVALARSRLHQSMAAYESGNAQEAARLALSAYLDGIEPIEPRLAARDAKLMTRVEGVMAEFRARLGRGATPAELKEQLATAEEVLSSASEVLDRSNSDAATTFIASFTILVREGLEALLLVVAIVAFLRKSGRQELMPYVHGGWISALAAGGLTWLVARYLIDISGASRELTEGYASLFAAFVLLTVGLWMHQKSVAGHWQRYLQSNLSGILQGRSAWLLAGLAFLMVYREVFETILFYAALSGEGNGAALLGGLVAGAAVLALISTALLKFSARLPIGKFFSVSSILIAVLAVVLAGKGAEALQEAGVLSVRTLPLPRIELVGLFPSVQTVMLQAIVALAAIAGFAYNARSARQARAH